jgi:hypothetical protein
MAVIVDGTTQGTRQRVLGVPFAKVAEKANVADSLSSGINFGPYEEKQVGVIHQAASSGFIVAHLFEGASSFYSITEILIGPNSNSLSQVSIAKAGGWAGGVQHTIPIQKGYFWRADNFSKVFFVGFK